MQTNPGVTREYTLLYYALFTCRYNIGRGLKTRSFQFTETSYTFVGGLVSFQISFFLLSQVSPNEQYVVRNAAKIQG
jgi:hypothetical protein